MGLLTEGFNGLIEIEEQYGNTPEGVALIDGVVEDALNLMQWPFQVDIIGLSVSLTEATAFFSSVRGRIKVYLAARSAGG